MEKHEKMYDKCMILHDCRYPEVEIESGLLKSLSISYLFPYGTLWINVGIMVANPKKIVFLVVMIYKKDPKAF